MNILLTIHHILRPDAGAEGVTIQLADAYRRLGHQAELFAFDHMPAGMPYTVKRLLFPYYVRRQINRPDRSYDVVDASSGDAWVWAATARAAKREQTALITRSHGLEHLTHKMLRQRAREGLHRLSWKYPLYHGGFHLWEVAQSFRLADGAVFLNRIECEYGQRKFGLSSSTVIANGITDPFLGRRFTETPLLQTEALNIAVVGRYDPLKGVGYAAEALTPLMRERGNIRVTFFGTQHPPDRVYSEYPAELHPRIGVVARYSHAELPELLEGYHIKLFPSLKEGFGMSLVEAMACGLAPVATSIPGPSDIVVDGENGLMVPPGQADALRAAVERLITDRNLLARLREAAWHTAQRYGWDQIARCTLAYYEACRRNKEMRGLPRSG